MKKHDTLVTLKIPHLLKTNLEQEAEQKGITLSELIRLRINNVLTHNGEDIPSISLRDNNYLSFKRCPRCNGIYVPNHIGQLYCCNMCGCNKLCNCGAKERQKLLII